MNVLWLTNCPSPYRVAFFSELGKYLKLTVLSENTMSQQVHRNRKWFVENYNNFKVIFLKQIKLGKLIINPEVIKYLNTKKYDFIVLGDYSTLTSILAAVFMRVGGVKYIISIDGAYERQGGGVKEVIKRYIISHAFHYFSTSKTSDEYLIKYGAQESNITRYNFTSLNKDDILETKLSRKEKEKFRRELKIEEEIAILVVGRFVKSKGIDFVLNAADCMPDEVGYYIVGDVPTADYLSIVRKKELKTVHFIRFQVKEELKKYYKACDIFVFPTRYDPWGLVVNEAMANGMPILSTDQSAAALHFIQDNENGFLYKVDDKEDYIRKLKVMCSDLSLLNKMSEKNIDLIQDYSIEKMAEQHLVAFLALQKEDLEKR
ncbi:MAG: glycosyltransferase family 4 protein [Ruminococcus sp.]|nr:glycosyltransferase family 4 protein [Ruminococcus sp.]